MLHTGQRGRDHLVVIRQVVEGLLKTVGREADLMELSRRQAYRIVARFEAKGDRAAVQPSRGRPPNNEKGLELSAEVLAKAKADVSGEVNSRANGSTTRGPGATSPAPYRSALCRPVR